LQENEVKLNVIKQIIYNNEMYCVELKVTKVRFILRIYLEKTRKIFVPSFVLVDIRNKKYSIAVTHQAATLLLGGRPVNYTFKLPIINALSAQSLACSMRNIAKPYYLIIFLILFY